MIYPIEKVVVFEKATGRVVSSGTAQMPERMVTDTLDVLVGASAVPNESYVQAGAVVNVSQKPSQFHDFDWSAKQWVANPESAWYSIKKQRARLLAASDWMVTKAAESGQTVPPEWVAYRQALRDITLQADPWVIVWPVAP